MSEERRTLTEEDLADVIGGKEEKVTYICQACGAKFKAAANKKWKGEPVCKNCR